MPATSQLATFTLALQHAARAWRREIDAALEAYGLSDATAFPLVHIARMGEGVRQGELADFLGLEGPSLVRLLDRLCEAGLVERRAIAGDRRVRGVHLTATGRAAVGQIEAVLSGVRERLFGAAAPEDLAAALRIFAILQQSSGRPVLLPEATVA
jgi:MarR family transcriptional regulator for hemolysin